uniref:Uncharacterized protein n=1 Tax=Micrurus spixii TaxID=129469 RepID=A0A2D4MJG9_9SAUR
MQVFFLKRTAKKAVICMQHTIKTEDKYVRNCRLNSHPNTELEHKFFHPALIKLASSAEFSGNCQVSGNISAVLVIERFAKMNKTDFYLELLHFELLAPA